MKAKKGFTIIELTIMVALLLILFAVAYKLVFGAVQRARDQASVAAIGNINSMYRMSTAFLFMDEKKASIGTKPISLPTSSASAADEKAIEAKMLEAFPALADFKYTLTDDNGIATQDGVTIVYYPYEDKPEERYIWVDGAVYHTFNKPSEEIK